jgi:hypothetical protein
LRGTHNTRLVYFKRMKKNYLLLVTACLFSVIIFAHDTIQVAGKADNRILDAIGPVITYTAITKSSCLANKSFSVTITDVDGVNTTSGTSPRLYYKRSTDGNIWNNNFNSTDGWKYVEATNTTSPFNFVFDYTLLNFGSGVSVGQTIQYFVVAQDLVATPNISINSGSFTIAPTSVNLTAAAFPINPTINSYTIVNDISAIQPITIGAAGDFSNFTSAGGLFNVINNVGLSQNTTVEIIDPLITEVNPTPIALSQVQNTGCSVGLINLIIKPASSVTATITGNVASNPMMRILSSNVTIDGSNNGTTSRNLTLKNTNATDPVVILYGSTGTVPISNSTLKNTICNNGASTTSCVVVSDGAVGGVPGYFNNITIQNNSIQKGLIGVQCAAAPSSANGSILISGNDLNSTSANQIALVGVYAEGLDGAVISNNNIGNFEPTTNATRYGIWVTTNTINTTVSGNAISGLTYTGSGGGTAYGIYAAPAVVASNINITGNTVSNISVAGTGSVFGIFAGGASGGITIQKNIISNIKSTNASGFGARGVSLATTLTAANFLLANNFIYDIAGAGSSTSPVARNGFGIYLISGGGYKIYNNSVNMNTNQLNNVGITAALMSNGISTAASLDIRNNIFANTQTGGAPAATRYAIYSTNANTIFSAIDYNDYYTNGTNLGFITSDRITLANIQTGFGSNINSINSLPGFVSSTDLHLNPTSSNCPIDNKGTFIATVTDDIDAQTRNSSTPDIGADEFTALSGSLAGIAATAVCSNKPVVSTGTTYTQAATCNLIATVVPSGTNAVAGNINTCVTLDATTQYFNGEPYVQRHYDIEPAVSNQTTTSATITLYFTNAEFVNYNTNNTVWPDLPTGVLGNADPNIANVRITQFHGTPTGGLPTSTPGNYTGARVLIVPTSVTYNSGIWSVTFNVTGFSGFYVHTTLSNLPLPVVVNYLTGRKQGSTHLLNWKVTCNSTPRVTMILERSADSRNFITVNTITADAVRCNQPFDYTDTDPLKGMNYYRLKMTDADGKVSYSSIVALLNAVKGFDIISIAPNPVVDNNFKLNVASAQAGKIDITIFDMQGRLIKQQNITLIAGFNSVPVNIANLSAGSYTIRGNMADEQVQIIRFVKQ